MALKELNASLIFDDKRDAFWRVTSRNSKNVSMTKVLSHGVFLNLLKSNTINRREEPRKQLGTLPFGYVDCLYGGPGNYKIAVLYPEKARGVKYYKDTYRVPYPNVLFIFDVKGGVLHSHYAFAVKDAEITAETVLYKYPFGNVGVGGSMCFGTIKRPNMTLMSSVDEVCQLFFNGETNDDLYTPEKTTKQLKQYELYKFLEGKKKFPYSILIRECSHLDKPIKFKDAFKM